MQRDAKRGLQRLKIEMEENGSSSGNDRKGSHGLHQKKGSGAKLIRTVLSNYRSDPESLDKSRHRASYLQSFKS